MLFTLKRFLQYFLGIILLIFSLPFFAEGGKGVIGGLFIVIGGLVCVPYTRIFLERELQIHFSKPLKYVLVIWGWLCMGIFHQPENAVYTGNGPQPLFVEPQDKVISRHKEVHEVKEPESSITTAVVVTTTSRQRAPQSPLADEENDDENIDNAQEEDAIVTPVASKPRSVKAKRRGYNHTATSREYIRGPRGGCYYINGSGNKTYVDRSLCD